MGTKEEGGAHAARLRGSGRPCRLKCQRCEGELILVLLPVLIPRRSRSSGRPGPGPEPGFPQGMTSRRAAIGCAAANSPFMDTSAARGSPGAGPSPPPALTLHRRPLHRAAARPGPAPPGAARAGRAELLPPPLPSARPSVPGRRRVWAEPRAARR